MNALSRLIRLAPVLATFALASCTSLGLREAWVAQPTGAPALRLSGPHGPLRPRQAAAVLRQLQLQAPNADALQRHLAIEQAYAGSALYTGNAVRILQDGAQTFPAMFTAIRAATQCVHLEYYILEDVAWQGESLGELLAARRAAGVAVDVLYDSAGSFGTPTSFFDSLRAAGARVTPYNPINPFKSHWRWHVNARDHRKLLVVDGRTAIMGGVNMSANYQSSGSAPGGEGGAATAGETAGALPPGHEYWRDTDIQITGPAVTEVDRLFREHWRTQGGDALEDAVTPASASTPADGDAEGDGDGQEMIHVIGSSPRALKPRYYATVLSSINIAEKRVWLTTGYFTPSHQERVALRAAARRGVDVRLLLPSHSDSGAALAVQRAAYQDLLETGVRIYERDGVVLHSKSLVIDGVWSVTGSSNFDHRSVLFNDEIDAVVIGSVTAVEFERIFQEDLRGAHEIALADWHRRPLREKLREQFWRAWETLL